MSVSTDPDHRFELAVDLRKMDIAHTVLQELGNKDEDRFMIFTFSDFYWLPYFLFILIFKLFLTYNCLTVIYIIFQFNFDFLFSTDYQSKWRRLGDLALTTGWFSLSLLLIH